MLLVEGLESGSEQEQFRKGLAESGDKHTHPLTQKFQLLGIVSVELCYGQRKFTNNASTTRPSTGGNRACREQFRLTT